MSLEIRTEAPKNSLQRTLKREIRLSGAGLHTGDDCAVVVHPAEEGDGIVFALGGSAIPAVAGNVIDTSRSTTLGDKGSRISTVEHLMAALAGSGVDNALVEVSGSELPALDGSALPYVEAIAQTGLEAQSKPKRRYLLREPVWVALNGGYIVAVPSGKSEINYAMRYGHPMIGSQFAAFSADEDSFEKDIAPARTFVIYEEVADLLSQRLAQGGSLSNTIVVMQDHMSCELRFTDELPRHKILDLIGDLALLGGTLGANIVAVRSGHALNVEFVRKLGEMVVRDGWEG